MVFFHPSMPYFKALLEGFLCRYGPLNYLQAFLKQVPMFELGEKKQVTCNKIRWRGRLFQHDDFAIGQEMQDTMC